MPVWDSTPAPRAKIHTQCSRSPLLAHFDDCILRAQENTLKVHTQNPIPFFLGCVGYGLLHLNAHIVYQNVELPKVLNGSFHNVFGIEGESNIRFNENCLRSSIPKAADYFLTRLRVDVRNDYLGSMISKEFGRCLT